MSDERRLAVLRAIVEDYVATTEPVGSKALTERHDLGVSPATIRNDMAVLEEEGLITQPHTSAGRIPTDKGYRLFVDRIADVKPLSPAERRAMSTLINQPVDLDDVLAQTVRALAQLTQQVALVQYPSVRQDHVRHIDLIALSERRLLVVVITESGRVNQRQVTTRRLLEQELLTSATRRAMAALEGQPLQQAELLLRGLEPQFHADQWVDVAPILDAIADVLLSHREDRVVLAGTANLARSNVDMRSLATILDVIEEHVVLLRLLGEMDDDPSRGVSVRIGEENAHQGLATSSVVSSGYGASDHAARLAIIGPTRMDYPTTMAAVRAVARYVTKIMSA